MQWLCSAVKIIIAGVMSVNENPFDDRRFNFNVAKLMAIAQHRAALLGQKTILMEIWITNYNRAM